MALSFLNNPNPNPNLIHLTIHYTSLLATLNEKIEELESLLHTLQIDPAPLTDIQSTRIVKLQKKLEDTRNKKTHTLKKTLSTTQLPVNMSHNSILQPPQKHKKGNTIMPLIQKTLLPTPPDIHQEAPAALHATKRAQPQIVSRVLQWNLSTCQSPCF